MQINSNFNVGGTDPVLPKRSATTSNKTDSTEVSFPGASALDEALAKVPSSRADVVARAKQLVADPNYPSGEMLKKLSNFLAVKLTTSEDSGQ